MPVYQKMHFADDPVVGGVPVRVHDSQSRVPGSLPAGTAAPSSVSGPRCCISTRWSTGDRSAFSKGGINFSEKLTTVSPTYAREILTPAYGFGMDGVLRRRAEDLVGILNGIDTEPMESRER